jgi:hypothetical protein
MQVRSLTVSNLSRCSVNTAAVVQPPVWLIEVALHSARPVQAFRPVPCLGQRYWLECGHVRSWPPAAPTATDDTNTVTNFYFQVSHINLFLCFTINYE